MVAFDAPSREECVAERPRSNIPQQALVLLNDPIFVEAARSFAERILRESKGTLNNASNGLISKCLPVSHMLRRSPYSQNSLISESRYAEDETAAKISRDWLQFTIWRFPSSGTRHLDFHLPRTLRLYTKPPPASKHLAQSRLIMDYLKSSYIPEQVSHRHRQHCLGNADVSPANSRKSLQRLAREPSADIKLPQKIKRVIHLCMAGGPSHLETLTTSPS